ncbi:MAG TPA: phosphoenolpyruvate--protein phosphotransferase, partial [Acidobacteriota bacterium]|nr:phosphoenolpyruvate--protein phosphotransferase [Acidobacteriota bacterium]
YESIQDEYLRERTSDIEDVANRLIDVLSGRRTNNLHLTQPSVVVAEDLLPTVLAELDLTNVLGIATDAGGWTSHTAIIARSLGVPSVLGLGSFAAQVHTGDPIIVDGTHDCVILNPTDATRRHYQNRLDQDERQKRDVLEHASLPAITLDSETCVLRANLELVSELPSLQKSGAHGIGLFRSEFIFLNELPRLISEEEQFQVYRQLVESTGPEGVVIRTIDLGSDKIKASDLFGEERNPALGLQGIRFTLKSKEIFRDQLRAIFRAGAYGRLSVMLPKVSCVSEVRAARQLIAEVKAELEQARIPHAAHLPVGVMVEIPSAVMIIDLLAREADFLSIGSNDLIQHTLAVDRANPQVAHLYEPLHPAVIRSLKQVVDAGKIAGTLVQICGEMAANPTCAVVLLGLGLRNFSMSPSAIPNIKRLVRSVRVSEAERLVTRVMELDTPRAIEQFLEGELSKSVPHFFANSQ